MVNSGTIISIVTLFLKEFYFDEHFVPKYTSNKESPYFYKNSSRTKTEYRRIAENETHFPTLPYFSKCCPPGYIYHGANRYCLRSDATPIYEEINFKTDLLKSGLSECPVILDRFVEKASLERHDGSGYVFLMNDSYNHYCLDNVMEDDDFYVVRICKNEEYCTQTYVEDEGDWCIKKCCADGYGFQDYQCVPRVDSAVRIEMNNDYFERTDGYAVYFIVDIQCSMAHWIDYRAVNFTIKVNGSLFHKGNEYQGYEYCVDTMYNTETKKFSDMVLLCEFASTLYIKRDFLKVGVVTTCICFAITIMLYIFFKPPQTLLIVGFCIVDFIFWSMYALRIFYVNFGRVCVIFGYAYFFLSISRLSWLNVLSYEIWLTIGKFAIGIGLTKNALFKRKICYVVYAVLVPTISTIIFILAHQRLLPLPEILQPNIDVSSCAIDLKGSDKNIGYIYLYIPVTILTLINLVIFLKTLAHFLKVRNVMRRISDATSVHKQKMSKINKKRGFIIFKLGLIMIVTWIYYLFAYLNRLSDHMLLNTIGDILIFLNIFEGVYFFLIFIVKWRDIRRILCKLRVLRKREEEENAGESTSTESVNEIPMNDFK
ncbi:hypothetical protein Trydic_g11589 [Trypoxylus dichotomus]